MTFDAGRRARVISKQSIAGVPDRWTARRRYESDLRKATETGRFGSSASALRFKSLSLVPNEQCLRPSRWKKWYLL